MGVTTEGRLDEMRWLSFAELARAKAISKRAAIRLANRHGWQHRPDNRGPVRVGVPASALGDPQRRPSGGPGAAALKVSAEIRHGRADPPEPRLARLAAEVEVMRTQITDLRLREASSRARAEASETEVARLKALLAAGRLARLRRLIGRAFRG